MLSALICKFPTWEDIYRVFRNTFFFIYFNRLTLKLLSTWGVLRFYYPLDSWKFFGIGLRRGRLSSPYRCVSLIFGYPLNCFKLWQSDADLSDQCLNVLSLYSTACISSEAITNSRFYRNFDFILTMWRHFRFHLQGFIKNWFSYSRFLENVFSYWCVHGHLSWLFINPWQFEFQVHYFIRQKIENPFSSSNLNNMPRQL